MNILVFVKQVPDTETRIQLQDGVVDTSAVKWVANPYDEFAIEEALRIKERLGQGKVTVVSLGPDRVKEAIKYALSLGADEGIHVKGDGVALWDPLAVATVLAGAAKKAGFDLILTGKQGVDHDWSQAGIILAELLDLPHVSVVVSLEVHPESKSGKAKREVEGGAEVVEFTLPAVITAQKGLNEPRYASLKGIMAAKKIAIDSKSISDLGLSDSDIVNQRVTIVSLELPPEKSGGRKIDGADPAAAAKEIVRYMKEEAKAL